MRERRTDRGRRKGRARLAVAVGATVMLAAPGLAAAETAFDAQVAGDLSGRPGEQVGTVTGSGCPQGTVNEEPFARIYVGVPHSHPGSWPLGEGDADAAGDFSFDLTIPADATPGTYELAAVCRNPHFTGEVVLGDLEILPPLAAPTEPSGFLTPGAVFADPGERLTFTAPVKSSAHGDTDAFTLGQEITLVRYPGAEVVGAVTAPAEQPEDLAFDVQVDAPDTAGIYQLVAFGQLTHAGPLGTLGQVHVADIHVVDGSLCPTAPFSDVPTSHPFCADITWLADSDIAGGYPDGTFRPSVDVTRQAFAAFLFRLAGEPDVAAPAEPSFSDVPASHPFFEEIEWLAGTGVTTGYPDGTFRPSVDVTRQATAAFLHRWAGEPGTSEPDVPSFGDVPTDHPFFEEIEWLAGTGVTTGYPDGTFRPSVDVTRQAAAAFLHRWGGADR